MVMWDGDYPEMPDDSDNENDDYKEKGKTPPLPPEVANGLSLIIGPEDGYIENADVIVRWCITPELTEHLIKTGVDNPHIILSTCTKAGDHEWRGVYPLNELMAYARFYQAGEQKIFASIINMCKSPTLMKDHKKNILMKNVNNYYSYMFQIVGKIERTPDDDNDILAQTEELVEIPAGVFATEVPAWLDWYVNMWHGKFANDDGCQFRTRAIIGLFKWIPMLAWAIIHTLFFGAMVLGAWGMGLYSWIQNWSGFKDPFDISTSTSMLSSSEGKHSNLLDSSYIPWIHWTPTLSQAIVSPFMLCPTIISIWLAVAGLISIGPDLDYLEAFSAFAVAYGIISGLLILWDVSNTLSHLYMVKVEEVDTPDSKISGCSIIFAAIILITICLFIWLPGWLAGAIFTAIGLILFTVWAHTQKWATDLAKGYFKQIDKIYLWINKYFGPNEDYTEMRELFCPKDMSNLTTDIDTLPTESVSWRLRFRNFKAKVCKPRQRR